MFPLCCLNLVLSVFLLCPFQCCCFPLWVSVSALLFSWYELCMYSLLPPRICITVCLHELLSYPLLVSPCMTDPSCKRILTQIVLSCHGLFFILQWVMFVFFIFPLHIYEWVSHFHMSPHRSDPRYKRSLGQTILNLSRVIPDGLLVFFPSYTVMRDCQEDWQNTGVWSKLSERKVSVRCKETIRFYQGLFLDASKRSYQYTIFCISRNGL